MVTDATDLRQSGDAGLPAPRWELLWLVLATVLAAVLRLANLGRWSFWGDEATQVIDVLHHPIPMYPISYWLMVLPLKLFGVHEWSARLVPAAIGIVTIPCLYFLVRRLFGVWLALLSAYFLAIAPWHIYWSQNARFYAQLFLLFGVSWLAYLIGLETGRRRWFALAISGLVLATFSHSTGLWLVILFAGSWLLLRPRIIAAVMPWQRLLARRTAMVATAFATGYAVFFAAWPRLFPASYPYAPYGSLPDRPGPVWLLAGTGYYIGPAHVVLGLVALALLAVVRDRRMLYLGLPALVPIAGLAVVSLVDYVANRYVFVSLLGWLLLAGVAVIELYRGTSGAHRLFALGLVAVIATESLGEDMLYFRYQNGNRPDWKGAFALVHDQARPSDRIVTSGFDPALLYLGEGADIELLSDLDPAATPHVGKRVWLVLDNSAEFASPELRSWINEHTRLVANLDVPFRARVFRMEVRLYDPATAHITD